MWTRRSVHATMEKWRVETTEKSIHTEKEKIIVPLDVSTKREALDLVLQLREHVGFFKVGLELLNSVGIDVVQEISKVGGNVFFDGKFHDIPNTVEGASRGVTRLGVKMFNVHAMGGLRMMEAAVKASQGESISLGIKRPIILGVTVLTSIDQKTMNEELRVEGNVDSQVAHLAKLAEKAGLDGVVASPQEIKVIHEATPNLLIVTPGVRPAWAELQDQKRVLTPGEAILKGASYLVIGRPITKPPPQIGTPVEAAKRIVEEMHAALSKGGDR
jgi:orotidine-5'-phosphate decarboxylase